MDVADKKRIKVIGLVGIGLLAALAAVVLFYNNFIWPNTALGKDTEDAAGGKYLVCAADEDTGTQLNLAAGVGKRPSPEEELKLLEPSAQAMANGTEYQLERLEDMTVAGYVWRTYHTDFPKLEARNMPSYGSLTMSRSCWR